MAHRQAAGCRRYWASSCGPRSSLPGCSWSAGDLADSSKTAHEGLRRAEEAGLGLAPYGLDLQYLHYLAHYADGDWDHAQQIADGFAVRVTSVAEARLSAMALFIDVARGSAEVATGAAGWSRSSPRTGSPSISRGGLLAEHALWQGDHGYRGS